jgi:hypothetical protein
MPLKALTDGHPHRAAIGDKRGDRIGQKRRMEMDRLMGREGCQGETIATASDV